MWRDSPSSSLTVRVLPAGFSRLARHTGDIQVAGVEDGGDPLAAIPDLIARLIAERDSEIEQRIRCAQALRAKDDAMGAQLELALLECESRIETYYRSHG